MIIEIFKAGTHTDASGNTREWTIQDLDTIVEKYNPSEHEAPVVIGHPKDNAPAYGWVKRIFRKGEKLYAELKDLVPEFVDWVKRGLYKKRSISLYPDLTLRHVGFLGAMPPAVKGLADVQFSDSDDITIEFSDYKMSLIGRIFRRLRDFIIDKYDIETADRIVNDYEIEELHKVTEVTSASDYKEKGGNEMEKVQELEFKLKEKEEMIAKLIQREKEKEDMITKLVQKEKEKEQEIERYKKELDEIYRKQRYEEFQTFCDNLIKEGRLIPALKSHVVDFMEILSHIEEYEFSEGEEKVKIKPIERFKSFLQALPKSVELSEFATKDKIAENKTKNIKEMSGWELIEMYKTNKQSFDELVQKL